MDKRATNWAAGASAAVRDKTKIFNRPSIFKNKEVRVQGMISKMGSTCFEERRKQLARIAGWDPKKVSDADTIEFLARGDTSTKLYLKGEIKR